MYIALNRLPRTKPIPALMRKAAGYMAMAIGAAILLKGLQLLYRFELEKIERA